MQGRRFTAGDIIYREGAPSDCVYFIDEGEVEVRRAVPGGAVTLGRLGKGEILGEMGVVCRQPRSASVVAVSDAVLVRVDGAAFIEAFGGEKGLALKLLRMVCERLAASNRNLDARPVEEQAIRGEVREVRLLGDSPEMATLLGNSGIRIPAFPFEIGLAPRGGGGKTDCRFDFNIPGAVTHLDRKHLRIELAADGRLQLRDLGSRLGCIVNGRRVSDFGKDGPTAPLLFGENRVVAGGHDSPIRFNLRVRRAGAVAA